MRKDSSLTNGDKQKEMSVRTHSTMWKDRDRKHKTHRLTGLRIFRERNLHTIWFPRPKLETVVDWVTDSGRMISVRWNCICLTRNFGRLTRTWTLRHKWNETTVANNARQGKRASWKNTIVLIKEGTVLLTTSTSESAEMYCAQKILSFWAMFVHKMHCKTLYWLYAAIANRRKGYGIMVGKYK